MAYKSRLLLKYCSSNKQGQTEKKTCGKIRTEETKRWYQVTMMLKSHAPMLKRDKEDLFQVLATNHIGWQLSEKFIKVLIIMQLKKKEK